MTDINSLFSKICKHMETKSEYFDVFIECNTRFEGWFEAEILKYILDKSPEISIVSTKKKFQNWGQPDIVLKYQNMTWIIELKAGVIKGIRNYNFYLIKYKVGAGKDFKRISKYDEDAWAIICLTPCNGSEDNNFILTVEQAQDEYNVKKLKEFKFNTPEGKPVTLTLWGKKLTK